MKTKIEKKSKSLKRYFFSFFVLFFSIGGFFLASKFFYSQAMRQEGSFDSAFIEEDLFAENQDISSADPAEGESYSAYSTFPIEEAISAISEHGIGKIYYVSPSGSDLDSGFSEISSLKTIQKAISLAQPGETIILADGIYFQDIISKRNGKSDLPITIRGSSGAIIKGGGNGHVIEINHDFITLDGFTVDGLYGSSNSKRGYRDKLIYAFGKKEKDGVTGLKIINMVIKNAGGECVRLRYFSRKNEIASNHIGPCGIFDFKFNDGGKNGEGIYIGTAPEQLKDGKNATAHPDQSNDNWIHNNDINTRGNECVDIKEASSGNIVENNKCTGQKDAESGGMDSRGNGNVFRYNEIFSNLGAGIRLGGDEKKDGTENSVYSNHITGNKSGGIKVMRYPQEKICGNIFYGNGYKEITGSAASKVSLAASCS